MNRFVRAGAFATAALSFFALIGAATSGAQAEVQAPQTAQTAVPPRDPNLPRFVAQPVIQQIPDTAPASGPGSGPASGMTASLADLVDSMPETELSGDMECLADAVYFEARGEPLDGQLAVARVVINRATSGLYPSEYCSVVTQPAQFSFVRHGAIPEPDRDSEAWRRAKAVARIAQQDLWTCEAEDALFFHADYVNPSWARRKTELARIDTHIFYR